MDLSRGEHGTDQRQRQNQGTKQRDTGLPAPPAGPGSRPRSTRARPAGRAPAPANHDHPPVAPHVIVLFGATGDLARRKLLPGLFHLSRAGLLPECRIVATSLEDLDDYQYQLLARAACDEFARGEVTDERVAASSATASATCPGRPGPTAWPRRSSTPRRRSAASPGGCTT